MVAPPFQLVVETSSVCNLRCPQCWIGLRQTNRTEGLHFMAMELFDRIMDQVQSFVKHTYLHLWGEPTLNPNLAEMIRKTKAFSTIDLATHGLFLDDAMVDAITECDAISISIDGVTQATYERYRVGGRLNEAMLGLAKLSAACEKKGKSLNWTYVVFKENEHEMNEARRLAECFPNVKLGFKAPVFWNRSAMTASMPTSETYRRYVKVGGEWALKADRFSCREFWQTIYVLPNADIITCCYDGAASEVMGNLNTEALLEIWNGSKYSEMRRNHISGNLNAMCEAHCNLAQGHV